MLGQLLWKEDMMKDLINDNLANQMIPFAAFAAS